VASFPPPRTKPDTCQERWYGESWPATCSCAYAQAYNRGVKLTRLITQFTYRIEPKADGGFIAHASDPNVPPLEAATREELQSQIQARIAAELAKEFPGLKVPLDRSGRKFEFHIEMKPGGGFTLHSADRNAQPIDGATHDDLQSHVAEKLMAIAGKHAGPELALALQSGTRGAAPVNASAGSLGQSSLQSGVVQQPIGISSTLGTTEAGRTATVVRVVLTMVVIAALIYFFFVYRR
jgi:hypothetical protein